jgi:hypothetical protein
MKSEKSAQKPKYEKPILIPLNLNYALGLCKAGSGNPSGPCRAGAQASGSHCKSGSVPGIQCRAGGTR